MLHKTWPIGLRSPAKERLNFITVTPSVRGYFLVGWGADSMEYVEKKVGGMKKSLILSS